MVAAGFGFKSWWEKRQKKKREEKGVVNSPSSNDEEQGDKKPKHDEDWHAEAYGLTAMGISE